MTPLGAQERAAEIQRILLMAAPLVTGTAYGPSYRRDTAVLIERAIAPLSQYIADAVAHAVQAEREACAKLAAAWQPDGSDAEPFYILGWEHKQTCSRIAAAIRARQTEPTGQESP